MKKNGKQDKPAGKWTMWGIPNVPELDSSHLDRPTGKDTKEDNVAQNRPNSARNIRQVLADASVTAISKALQIEVDMGFLGNVQIGIEGMDGYYNNVRAPVL
ncbi:MAG: hypothetical protein ACKVQC_00990 [Elusimicrobiota bacterium]